MVTSIWVCVITPLCLLKEKSWTRQKKGKNTKEKYTAEMEWKFDEEQEKELFFYSDDSSGLTASLFLIILCVCVCVCVSAACTDTELHSLSARLKDWFGVLHLDANRDLKSSDSFDSTTGREYIPMPCACVCVRVCTQ